MGNIERLRRTKGFTQVELAAKIGVTQGMISAYENGVIPTLPIAIRLADILGVTPKDLLEPEQYDGSAA